MEFTPVHHGWSVDPGGSWAKSEGLWIVRLCVIGLESVWTHGGRLHQTQSCPWEVSEKTQDNAGGIESDVTAWCHWTITSHQWHFELRTGLWRRPSSPQFEVVLFFQCWNSELLAWRERKMQSNYSTVFFKCLIGVTCQAGPGVLSTRGQKKVLQKTSVPLEGTAQRPVFI